WHQLMSVVVCRQVLLNKRGRGLPNYKNFRKKTLFIICWDERYRQTATKTKLVKPNRSQFFQYDSFAVSCTADSSGWTVKRNTSVHVDQECHKSGGVPGESLCVIEMAYPSDTGLYWCENERGWSSNAVSISVTYAGVILESPPHPLTDGDNVTLSCFYKTETRRTATSDFTANFYKNGVLLGSGAAGRMTLTAVSRSDEGLYRCEHPDGEESEESWLTVRGTPLTFNGYTLMCLYLIVKEKKDKPKSQRWKCLSFDLTFQHFSLK
uniref:Ig-like domain-containing protein n=1 Tax=Oryzias sinensis TaxID=183150 RepID=A0A8C7X152_9TELE